MAFFFTVLYVIASYLRPWELYPELNDYRVMLILGILCGTAVVWEILSGATDWLRAPQTGLMVAFVAWLGISVAMNGWFGGALKAWSDFSTTAFVFLFTAVTINSFSRLKILAIAIVCSTLIIAVQGIAAYHFGYRSDVLVMHEGTHEDDDAVSDADPPPDDGIHIRRIRSVGFLNDPNDLAQALLLALPLLMATWRRGRFAFNFSLVLIPAAILLYATYLTFSRGALIALAVIVVMAAKERWGFLAASISAGAMALLALLSKIDAGRGYSTSEASAAGRIDAWSLGLQLLRQHPLAGVGFNQFLEFNDLTAHNSYVLCFAELGVVGYFLWIALIVVSARQLNRLMTGSEDAEFVRWTSAVQKSFFAFLASAFFLSRTYSVSLYILLGIITGLYAFSRNDRTVLARPFWDCTWRTAAAGFSSIACIYAFIVGTHLLGQ